MLIELFLIYLGLFVESNEFLGDLNVKLLKSDTKSKESCLFVESDNTR